MVTNRFQALASPGVIQQQQQAAAMAQQQAAVAAAAAADTRPPFMRDLTMAQVARLRHLIQRIQGYPLDQSAAELLVEKLAARRITEVELLSPRPLVVSDVLTGVGQGEHNLTWTFRTLGVVTGISAVVYPGETGETGQNLFLSVMKGGDGGYVLGDTADPVHWSAFGQVSGQLAQPQPLPIQAVDVKTTNQWTGILTIDAAIGQNEVDVAINWHGVGLWSPSGELAG